MPEADRQRLAAWLRELRAGRKAAAPEEAQALRQLLKDALAALPEEARQRLQSPEREGDRGGLCPALNEPWAVGTIGAPPAARLLCERTHDSRLVRLDAARRHDGPPRSLRALRRRLRRRGPARRPAAAQERRRARTSTGRRCTTSSPATSRARACATSSSRRPARPTASSPARSTSRTWSDRPGTSDGASAAWRVFEAMAYRLHPARRILFAVAVPLLFLGWCVLPHRAWPRTAGFPAASSRWDGLLIAAASLLLLPAPHGAAGQARPQERSRGGAADPVRPPALRALGARGVHRGERHAAGEHRGGRLLRHRGAGRGAGGDRHRATWRARACRRRCSWRCCRAACAPCSPRVCAAARSWPS